MRRPYPRAATAALLLAAPALAGTAAASPSVSAPEPTPAPSAASAKAVPGTYIVTLDQGVDPAGLAERLDLKPEFVYSSALNGFAVPLTPLQLDAVRLTPGVQSVEEDSAVSAPPTRRAGRPASRVHGPSPTWGLDRIDQHLLPLDNSFTTAGDGSGVTAYILDTGIDYGHEEFGGRAAFGFDAIGDGLAGQDCQGHGTHVAGTVGGTTYGVAPKVSLVSVRVLNCEGRGQYSGIIAGLDWVAKNAKQPAVLNGSLGGTKSAAVNNAVDALSEAGVLPVLAAGNTAQDACEVSPASAARAVTVAASDQADEQASFSNWGSCVHLYAPGQAIDSALLGGGAVALSGTSMAAPHVTGAVALHQQEHPAARPSEIVAWLVQESTKEQLKGLGAGSPNQLLFTGGR
ncbi:peptidase S8 [Streptomyces venezuelae]|uniref:Peptidase S8 n=1 Tax=Streptomyces venezuelae TaxID=54571 RepID=A0A5P2D0B0_STRVZ|nr:S8 family peptidase [Streptomyces venezuelae]QES46821.1 peptidase S8 [Streptomyces venezuelae]